LFFIAINPQNSLRFPKIKTSKPLCSSSKPLTP
jgi:hypothetical protein